MLRWPMNLPESTHASVPAPDPASHGPRAWQCPIAHLLFWGVLAFGLVLDISTKNAADHYFLSEPRPADVVLIDGVLEFTYVRNYGALFGLGQGKTAVFVVASLVSILIVLSVFAFAARRQRWVQLACALILVGAVGNLYDRAVYGHVRDFIHISASVEISGHLVRLWPWVFNVADMGLVGGVSILVVLWYIEPMVQYFRSRRLPKQPGRPDSAGGSA